MASNTLHGFHPEKSVDRVTISLPEKAGVTGAHLGDLETQKPTGSGCMVRTFIPTLG